MAQMTFEEEESVLADLRAGNLTAQKAITRLVAGRRTQLSAERRVLIQLGGGDLVQRDAQGREYYRHSGKLVAEVDELMRK